MTIMERKAHEELLKGAIANAKVNVEWWEGRLYAFKHPSKPRKPYTRKNNAVKKEAV